MPTTVQMIGLDFGTTTSTAVVAETELTRNAVTGRTDLDSLRARYRSEMVFTPFIGECIDLAAVARQLDAWFDAGRVRTDKLFGGGALLTGLTAQRDNADALVKLIRQRLGDTLIATANDPCLESWLAFMGSSAELSRSMPQRRVINLDIGGGTTNLALGQAGEVLRTGCLFVGARHVQVEPGTYRIVRLSRYAEALFESLGIAARAGDDLTDGQVDGIVMYYANLLEAAVNGDRARLDAPTARLHEQVAFLPSPSGRGAGGEGNESTQSRMIDHLADESSTSLTPGPSPGGRGGKCESGPSPSGRGEIITLSGGVGELVYAHLDGKPWPNTTAFGDLGIDLARRLMESSWADDLRRYRPLSAGRATVFGLLRHSTEISGSTLHLPNPRLLPLTDLPILGTISTTTTGDDLKVLLELAARSERGACVRVHLGSLKAEPLRSLGQRIATALRGCAFPGDRPLVLLMHENVGKALGQYVSEWGNLAIDLLVIDEVPTRDAQYARIGAMKQQVVPVSFYGLNEPGVT